MVMIRIKHRAVKDTNELIKNIGTSTGKVANSVRVAGSAVPMEVQARKDISSKLKSIEKKITNIEEDIYSLYRTIGYSANKYEAIEENICSGIKDKLNKGV